MKKSLIALALLMAAQVQAEAQPQAISAQMPDEPPLQLRAAGSLKTAMNEVVAAFTQQGGAEVAAKYGPSGLLRQQIEQGESVALFASANMKHPQTLKVAGFGLEVTPFARNQLCALAQPGLKVTTETLLDTLLSADVVVGTSTPKADPSGDYAFAAFDLAEAQVAGAAEKLKAKARQLTGGPDSPKPPKGVNNYAHVMREKQADVFLTYCTNGRLAQKEFEELQVLALPEALAVGADYGLLVIDNKAQGLADFIVSPKGQAILASYGFAPPRAL